MVIYTSTMFFVIVGFTKISNEKYIDPDNHVQKKISVIIPVRNEEKNILDCLLAIDAQDYCKNNFEVIVVNDHSIDSTLDKLNRFIKEHQLNVLLFSLTDKTGKKEALKLGIEQCNYDVIASTDADCIVKRKWLDCISKQFNKGADMLLGPLMFKENNGFLSAFQTLDMLAIQGMEFGTLYFKTPILNNGANLSYLKKAFHEVDGFDDFNTPSGDDIFLLEKFKFKNKKIKGLLSDDFIVETDQELTLSGLLNQRLRWSSKTKYYADKLLIYFGSIVLIQNITIIFIYITIPLVDNYTIIFTILLFCKWVIDFILLFLVASFFGRRKTLFYFIPVQIVYPFYLVIIWMASLTMKFEWKGRKF